MSEILHFCPYTVVKRQPSQGIGIVHCRIDPRHRSKTLRDMSCEASKVNDCARVYSSEAIDDIPDGTYSSELIDPEDDEIDL